MYCCQTDGTELSKCVYLASMGVKMEHIAGVQNAYHSDGHVC